MEVLVIAIPNFSGPKPPQIFSLISNFCCLPLVLVTNEKRCICYEMVKLKSKQGRNMHLQKKRLLGLTPEFEL